MLFISMPFFSETRQLIGVTTTVSLRCKYSSVIIVHGRGRGRGREDRKQAQMPIGVTTTVQYDTSSAEMIRGSGREDHKRHKP